MIYLSGKITGLDPEVAAANFKRAADTVRKTDLVSDIFNPYEECRLRFPEYTDWETYMEYCLEVLKGCTDIYMLPDWQDSKGARVEHDLARVKGIRVYYL